MIKVAAYTGGRHAANARFRVRQYIAPLRKFCIDVTEFTAPLGSFPPPSVAARPFWLIASLASRVPSVIRSRSYDVVWIQREMISTLLTLEGMTRRPRLFDVDDAIYLNQRRSAAQRLAQICDAVICGNQFLADYFSRYNRHIAVIPTAVDTDRFRPPAAPRSNPRTVIGWSGPACSVVELEPLQHALATVLRHHPDAVLRIMAEAKPHLPDIPAGQLEYVRWSPGVEVDAIQSMDIGIMPLSDSEWNRGKCSYKMLLYMACGVPVVASPVGMNAEVFQLGEIGLPARNPGEWSEALDTMLAHQQCRSRMAVAARDVVVRNFSIQSLLPSLAAQIASLC